MNKRFAMLLSVSALLTLSLPAWAQSTPSDTTVKGPLAASETTPQWTAVLPSDEAEPSSQEEPEWVVVKKGQTVKYFCQKYHLTEREFIAINHKNLKNRRFHLLVPGERVNINSSTAPEFREMTRYAFPRGDPAGRNLEPDYLHGQNVWPEIQRTLRRELAAMEQKGTLPSVVLEWYKSQVEHEMPPVIKLETGPGHWLITWGTAFGGYNKGSELKFWEGDIINQWMRNSPKGLVPIPWRRAIVFSGVQTEDKREEWRLVFYLDCQNSTNLVRQLEEVVEVAPPPPPVQAVPAPEYIAPTVIAEPAPQPQVQYPVVEETPTNRDYMTDYVAWLTDEYVRLDEAQPDYQSMNNLFIGQEFTLWASSAKRFGLRVRNAEALFDMKARSGDHNAGLVLVPFSNRRLRLDIEGGIGYSAIERLYYEFDHPDDATWTWEEKKRTTDGFGPYVRTQWLLPGDIYADLKWRDHGVIQNLGGYLTLRPGWFYGKLAYDHQLRPETSRHFDGQTITFAADTMIMNEARLGISFSPRFLVYGSYQHWEYSSRTYWSTRFGPGGGFEIYPFSSPAWRIDANVIRFKNFDQLRLLTDEGMVDFHTRNREWRAKLGIVYARQPK